MISRSIPSDFNNLYNLQYLYLCNNYISGDVFPSLSSLDTLKELLLCNLLQIHSIPPYISNLGSLALLDLQDTVVSGTLPSTIFSNWKITNNDRFITKLEYSNSSNTSLHGKFPSTIGCLSTSSFFKISVMHCLLVQID